MNRSAKLRALKASMKSLTAGLRRAKQREREPPKALAPPPKTPQPVPHSRDWVLRHRLWRSVMERGLGLAAWSQNAELGSCASWARVKSTIAEGTQKEVWAHRSSKASLLGRSRGRVADDQRNIFLCVCMDS